MLDIHTFDNLCGLVRDSTCRLFDFQGLDDRVGQFSFDHMFGF